MDPLGRTGKPVESSESPFVPMGYCSQIRSKHETGNSAWKVLVPSAGRIAVTKYEYSSRMVRCTEYSVHFIWEDEYEPSFALLCIRVLRNAKWYWHDCQHGRTSSIVACSSRKAVVAFMRLLSMALPLKCDGGLGDRDFLNSECRAPM